MASWICGIKLSERRISARGAYMKFQGEMNEMVSVCTAYGLW